MTLNLYTIDIAPYQLADCLQSVINGVSINLEIVEVEWWNRPVEMLAFSTGIDRLKQCPSDCTRGSAFGAQLEIRWRKVGDNLRVVIFSDMPLTCLKEASPKFTWKSIPAPSTGWDGKTKRERTLLLWGSDRMSDGTWSELRIGRPLAYPVGPEQKGKINAVEIKIIEYLDSSGQVVLSRRAGLKARLGKAIPESKPEAPHE